MHASRYTPLHFRIQEGIDVEAAAQRARDAGRTVVMGRCLYKDYVRLFTA